MKRREAEFGTKFGKWAYHEWPDKDNAYFELKVSLTDSLPFSAVSDKQVNNLGIKKFVHKFSDFDRMGTPFDMVCFCGKGYVVIQFYRPGNKEFFIIPRVTFLQEKEVSARKSLTETRARELGMVCMLK
jgi:hypothetical protein